MATKTNKNCECKNCKKLKKQLDKAIYELATIYGAWCIDRDPNEASIDWIRENAFRFLPKIPKKSCSDS